MHGSRLRGRDRRRAQAIGHEDVVPEDLKRVMWSCPAGTSDRSIWKVNTSGFAGEAMTSAPVASVTVMFTCWLRNV